LEGNGPSLFCRLEGMPTASGNDFPLPLGGIKIHPDSWNSSKYKYYGGFIIIESAFSYLIIQCLNPIGTPTNNYKTAIGLKDAIIGCDFPTDEDWYYPYLKTVQYTSGNTYTNCLIVKLGSRLMFVQGQEDWRLLSNTKDFITTNGSYGGLITIS